MKKIISTLLICYIFILIVQFGSFLTLFQKSEHLIPKVAGEIRLCINHPPRLNYTCSDEINIDEEFYCQVNATDEDAGQELIFEVTFINSTELFNITPEGIINFTPDITQRGNYTFVIDVLDDTGCENYYDSTIATLEVIKNWNSPPHLTQPIPNTTINQDTIFTGPDLDNFFADLDGDPITYTFTYSSHISVSLTSGNQFIVRPNSSYYGTEDIIFFAWDPYLANTSTTFRIKIRQTSSSQDATGGGSGGGGGGGGGGGFSNMCIPKWYCQPWGRCLPEGLMRRECFDTKNCSSNIGKPNVTMPCEFTSTCYDGIKGNNEEGIDCGGVCEPCGTCYDNICNNNEDCLSGATAIPDCGGDCKPCEYKKESCYDRICNNNEDCTKNLTSIPDCGGNCRDCAALEKPLGERNLFWFWLLSLIIVLLLVYSLKKSYTHLKKNVRKKHILEYERKLLLQTKITQSLLDDLEKVERMLLTEPIEKVILLFVTLIRRFFKELFSLKYEFTYEELKKEIESTKISQTFKKVLFRFFDRGLEIEYSGKNVSKEEMLAMISEFKAILGLTSEEPVKSKEIIKDDKRISGTELIFALIRDAESSIMEDDLPTALELYNNITAKFHGLNYEDKKKIHSFIVRLYEEIKAAKEKLK